MFNVIVPFHIVIEKYPQIFIVFSSCNFLILYFNIYFYGIKKIKETLIK